MYYNKRKLFISIMWVIIGIALIALEITGVMDSPVFSGMGGGLLIIGAIQIYKNIRYHNDKDYKEKTDIAYNDERNRYIRMKAWSWAGYIFVIAASVISIMLFVMKETEKGQIISYCMCTVLVIYCVAYMILQKKN